MQSIITNKFLLGMLVSHGLNSNSNLYKATSVTWDLKKDFGVKESNEPTYTKLNFEDYWDIIQYFYFLILWFDYTKYKRVQESLTLA